MKIASYNINGIKGRIGNLLKWLAERQPEIVCLQELKCDNHSFPIDEINDAGYQAIWLGQKAWNGVAVLSKKSIKELRRDLPGEDPEFTHSRYLEVFTYDMVIACIYLPFGNPLPGPKYEFKKRWFARLIAHAKTLISTGLPVMMVGDYNVIPTELDTYKPEKYKNDALFRPEIRENFQMLLKQGWTDAIRLLHPDEAIYTYWDYLRKAWERNAGLRLDHLLITPDLALKLKAGDVDKQVRGWEGASDHAPVWIELEARPLKKNLKRKEVHLKLPAGKSKEWPDDISELLKDIELTPMPERVKPMKATLVDGAFDEPGWIYEIKWDGYRAVSYLHHHNAEIYSRNHLEFKQFEEIAEALNAFNLSAVLDGEIVALRDDGSADFGALQNWKNTRHLRLQYYVFDILWLEGHLLTELTLTQRRQLLKYVLPEDDEKIKISQAFSTSGIDFFEAAKKMKLEGIIAKRANSYYRTGSRSEDWLKIKVKRRQEVIIGGFTRNAGTEKYFSALALGVYNGEGHLIYIGKVGTGFTGHEQKVLMDEFKDYITKTCPFEGTPDVDEFSRFRTRDAAVIPTWLKPGLVCEIEFAEFTGDGKVRQASFKGLRKDKDPKEVIMEIATKAEAITRKAGQKSKQPGEQPLGKEKSMRPERKSLSKKAGHFLSGQGEVQEKEVNGHTLKFTNLNKLYWPEDGVSKRDMFNYYDAVAPLMLPHLKDRPMSLNRFPGGIHGSSFYQKDVKETAPSWARTMPHTSDSGEEKEYLLGNDEATLLWMASLGCIEINPWFSRAASPDQPDYCVIDLDPDQNTFDEVIEAALVTRQVLEAIGVTSYPKTSGSTGMHIYIPLGAQYDYRQSQLFANLIAREIHRELPGFTTLERKISKRGGKMYLDFMQNRPGATIAGVYSLRPKPGATVSMPLLWEEVKPGLKMKDFTLFNAIDRLKETGDLFAATLGKGIDMQKALGLAKDKF